MAGERSEGGEQETIGQSGTLRGRREGGKK